MPTDKRAPTPSPRGRKLGDVAPALQVWKSEELAEAGVDFSIVAPPPRKFSGRFGESWAITIARADTGEKGVILFASNDVRDQNMEAVAAAIRANPSDTFGPLYLEKIRIDGNPNPMWEIRDREDAPSA